MTKLAHRSGSVAASAASIATKCNRCARRRNRTTACEYAAQQGALLGKGRDHTFSATIARVVWKATASSVLSPSLRMQPATKIGGSALDLNREVRQFSRNEFLKEAGLNHLSIFHSALDAVLQQKRKKLEASNFDLRIGSSIWQKMIKPKFHLHQRLCRGQQDRLQSDSL